MARIGSSGSGGAASGGFIPEYNSDPVSPSPEEVWVLHTPAGSPIGLLLALTYGVGQYELSYKTLEGPIVRVPLT